MAEAQTFKKAYSVLQGHAETLRRQTEPAIDDLLHIVEESVEAYKVCKERIDAVEKALQKALVDVGDSSAPNTAVTPSRPGAVAPAAPAAAAASNLGSSSANEMNDDVPF